MAIDRFTIDYNKDIGIYKRYGWSIAINGAYYSRFIKNPIVAIWAAFKKYKKQNDEVSHTYTI